MTDKLYQKLEFDKEFKDRIHLETYIKQDVRKNFVHFRLSLRYRYQNK